MNLQITFDRTEKVGDLGVSCLVKAIAEPASLAARGILRSHLNEYLLRSQPEKQRLRSPTFFVNLQITFDSKETVGDLGTYRLLLIAGMTIKNL